MKEWWDNLHVAWKIVIGVLVVSAIFALVYFFVPKYRGPEKNCIYWNEKANLHNEYYITVTDFADLESISVVKNKGDIDETELIGTDKHFISVTVLIEHINVTEPKENHNFDINDFKLKDHTGVQIKNLNLFSKENGVALENKNFATTNAQTDYKWVETSIEKGTQKEIVLFFEVPENISTLDTIIVLEADFFGLRSNGRAGTDIVLAERKD